jgi:chromosome segregation ATPase
LNNAQTQDLAGIVGNLNEKLAQLDQALTHHMQKQDELKLELASIAANKSRYAADLAEAGGMVAQFQRELSIAANDLALSRGTSIQGQKQEAHDMIERGRLKWTKELELLQTSFEHDSQAETDTTAVLLEHQNALAALLLEKSDVAATRERFSREHANLVKQLGLEVLAEIDSELSSLQAKIDQARAHRQEQVRQLALDLAPWPQIAEATLAEVIEDQADSPAVTADIAKLAEAQASLERSKRELAQSGTNLDPTGSRHLPTISGYEREVVHLTARIETLRRESRRTAAIALLKELAVLPSPSIAVVEVEMQAGPLVVVEKGVTADSGFGSQSAPRIHFL